RPIEADAGGGATRPSGARRRSVIVAESCLEETVEVATRVLIAGGGVAALEAALALRALAEDRVSVELLAPEPQFWYRPLAVAEPFGLGGGRRFGVLELAAGAGRGALTFRGPADTEKIRRLLEEIVAGQVGRIAFVVPWGAVWSLPIYELALVTAV